MSLSPQRHRPGARTAAMIATMAATMIATTALPTLTQVPDTVQAGPRYAQAQRVSAEGKKGGKKQRNVTKRFSSDAAISMPDGSIVATDGPANPYPSAITVSGIKKGHVLDVNLTLRGLTHTFPSDLNFLLVAPDGRNAMVMSDVGNPEGDEAVTDLTITLDDEASANLPEDALLTSGAFKPTDGDSPGPSGTLETFPAPAPALSGASALSTFDGRDPNGTWQLFILDDDPGDTGVVARGWSLEIKARTKATSHHKKGKH